MVDREKRVDEGEMLLTTNKLVLLNVITINKKKFKINITDVMTLILDIIKMVHLPIVLVILSCFYSFLILYVTF